MCGICGFFPYSSHETPSCETLRGMCAHLRHRGPDETGIYNEAGIGLGHQRLKVIDLVAGQQPMKDVSGRYALVFNGEVYNYKELRTELQSKGYVFTTHSDTEVLLYGLIANGVDFLQKVNGMFAFAFWDAQKKSLLLARDRFGVKPLYYAHVPHKGVYFASEAFSIACVCPELSAMNAQSAYIYLGLSYIPSENSIFTGIKKLPEGRYLYLSPEQKNAPPQTWWNLAAQWQEAHEASKQQIFSSAQWQEAFQSTLEDAIRIRLKADVPLGIFLSGGVDSATVAALASRHAPGILSFTMAFEDPSFNEGPHARETAQALGTTHHEAMADLGGAEHFLQVIKNLDEPFADTSLIPMHALCALARKHVTVALTGDGADELLGGYITHRATELYRKVRPVPAAVIKILRHCIALLPDSHKKVNTIFKLKQFLAAHPREESLAHACWRLLFYPEDLQKIFPHLSVPPDIFSYFHKAWEESACLPYLDRFLYVDYKTWLAHDILFKADRASMHNSLELRSPFLDYRLFTLCAQMPTELKRAGSTGKIILRRVAENMLPASCLQRPKVGFNAPVAQWLTGQWKELSEESFTAQNLSALGLEPAPIRKLWQQHQQGWYSHGYQLFNVLVLDLWKKSTSAKMQT